MFGVDWRDENGHVVGGCVRGLYNFGNYPRRENTTGKAALLYFCRDCNSVALEASMDLELKNSAYSQWKMDIWSAIHDSAQTQYYENRQKLKARLSRLQEELSSQDALSLRKKEREEVMKGVLRFLICPDIFEFFPDNIFQAGDEDKDFDEVLYELGTTGLLKNEGDREAFLYHGEMIKFLHHAIEWENILYFLYPYFWTHPTRWEFKKYLNHPDPIHRAFLKAGSARVVLTIRPGFEDAFLAFINTGDMNDLPPSPYLEIGQEFKNYSNTNYPGIPAANPVESYRPLLTKKQQAAWKRMQLLIELLEVYHRVNGRYPSTEQGEGLTVLRDFFPFKDPWGNDYLYNFPGQHELGKYDLYSLGADGQSGGDGINADITNWDSILPKDDPKQIQASQEIELIGLLLEDYRTMHGSYPTTDEGLSQLKEIIPLKDTWGNVFDYRCPGQHLDYDLVSFGANGEPGGEGEDADITNWAEASLIGQWFEYTPTSALDIAFDEKMPDR